MYEFGKSAMEYVVDSMNSVGNVKKTTLCILTRILNNAMSLNFSTAENIRCPESCAPPDPDAPEMPICGSDGRTYETGELG